ncbi:MAG: hypothetical protein ACPL1Y_01470 [Thermoplasmata archaeon]
MEVSNILLAINEKKKWDAAISVLTDKLKKIEAEQALLSKRLKTLELELSKIKEMLQETPERTRREGLNMIGVVK